MLPCALVTPGCVAVALASRELPQLVQEPQHHKLLNSAPNGLQTKRAAKAEGHNAEP